MADCASGTSTPDVSPQHGNPLHALDGDDARHSWQALTRDEQNALTAAHVFDLANVDGDGALSGGEALGLVARQRDLEPMARYLDEATESGDKLLTKEVFIACVHAHSWMVDAVWRRFDLESNPEKKRKHDEWLHSERLRANGVSKFTLRKSRPGASSPPADVEAGPAPPPAPQSKAMRVASTFALLFVPVAVFLTVAIVASRYGGSDRVCSATCRCEWEDLWRHIVVRRLPYDIPLHVYAAHTFSALVRRESRVTRHLILPIMMCVGLEFALLWGFHALVGVGVFAESMVALGCTIAVICGFGVKHKVTKRALFAVAVSMYAAVVLAAIHVVKEAVISETGADVVLTLWPVLLFAFGEVFVLALDKLLAHLEGAGAVAFSRDQFENEQFFVPDRQLLHVAIAFDCFNDAARALLVLTIDDTAVLLTNLALTIALEAVSRNNLHKWLLAYAVRRCYPWEPAPTRLENLIRASQLYAGYMPFPAFVVILVVGYFPWASGFVECDTGQLRDLNAKPYLLPLLFLTEAICTAVSMAIHHHGRCLLPKDSKTGDLAPVLALRGWVQCTILGTALACFVMYGFSGSGDIALASRRLYLDANATRESALAEFIEG